MNRNIVNDFELANTVDTVLRSIPPDLQTVSSLLRPWLRFALQHDSSVRRARLRRNDPSWVRTRIEQGHQVFRFFPNKLEVWYLQAVLEDFARVAELIASDSPGSREARSFFRGLSHKRPSLGEAQAQAEAIIGKSKVIKLRAGRFVPLRPKQHATVGRIVGQACVTLSDLIRLGREGRNCLTDRLEYWEKFTNRVIDVWALRISGRLVAVLEVQRSSKTVVTALGPHNDSVHLNDVHDVAAFCSEMGFLIAEDCHGLLPEFASQPIVPPRLIQIGQDVAHYCEWPNAVRIDMRSRASRIMREPQSLSLAFEPQQPCGAALLQERDPSIDIMLFGRKKVRRVVRAVALDQIAPTLVQHRLLALCA